MRKLFTLLLTTTILVVLGGFVFAVDPLFDTNVDYGAGGCISIISIDLDGDDDIDLVTGSSVLLNNGDGTFQAPVSYDAGGGTSSIFSADLDGDGDNDLATLHSVLLNNGDGTFQETATMIWLLGINQMAIYRLCSIMATELFRQEFFIIPEVIPGRFVRLILTKMEIMI